MRYVKDLVDRAYVAFLLWQLRRHQRASLISSKLEAFSRELRSPVSTPR
jgi:hypothetical protein